MPRSVRSLKALTAALLLLLAAALLPCPAGAEGSDSALCLRRHTGRGWADERHGIPTDAVTVFTYEGRPRSVHVGENYIAADYGVSGVLFDVATGRMVRRYTATDGWPQKRPDAFGPKPSPPRPRSRLVDPGVVAWRRDTRKPGDDPKKPPLSVADEVKFGGRTFRAMHLALQDILRTKGWPDARKQLGRWGAYLHVSSQRSCIEAVTGGKARRYTTADGLAGNIVSHLAVCGDTLWAACVDVYDDREKAWGPGGLCRYDSQADRWVHVKTLAGRPVRWVTLLEAHGDELWVGFRQGKGLAGEKIVYGMGLYPGLYRPHATAIVLARRKDGKWTAWSRKPRPERPRTSYSPTPPKPAAEPPTEIPRTIAALSDKALLYSQTWGAGISGNFALPMDGHVSLLDLAAGTWRDFDTPHDLGARRLTAMHVERSEVILLGEANVYQWEAGRSRWRRLDSRPALASPWIQAVTPIGQEVWIGYASRGYGSVGVHGISRYNARTGQWTFLSAKHLGTRCSIQVVAAGPDDQAWILFGYRMSMYMAAGTPMLDNPRPSDVPSKPGVGRFADGKWTFPVKLPGVPTSIERSRRGPKGIETWRQPVLIEDLAAAGGAVFVANRLGVYRGPGQWRRIYDGEAVRIWPAADGRELSILRYDPKRSGTEESKHDLGRYAPKTGKLTFRPIKPGELDIHRLRTGEFFRHDSFPSGAVRLPARKPGDWYVMSLNTDGRVGLVETHRAFWIATPGQLIRIDRAPLPDWVGR